MLTIDAPLRLATTPVLPGMPCFTSTPETLIIPRMAGVIVAVDVATILARCCKGVRFPGARRIETWDQQ